MFLDLLKESLTITFFVLVMMMLIEYLTVQSEGKWNRFMQQNPVLQVFIGAFLGLIPGCLGAYTAVSLYVHRVMGFAALVSVMIATTGDEAFVMLSTIPLDFLTLNLILLIVAVGTGLFMLLFKTGRAFFPLMHDFPRHEQGTARCKCFRASEVLPQLKNISFLRATLLTLLTIFLVFYGSGSLGPTSWDWIKITIVIVGLTALFIIATAPEDFLIKHLWEHTIKKHVPRIFLWTLGAFLAIELLLNWLDLEHWLRDNLWMMMLAAVLIGIIPQSGPNIIFITLFAGGAIPFSILIANSIVQDGHGAIPLLAESRKQFFKLKMVKVIVGLVIGAAGLLIGF